MRTSEADILFVPGYPASASGHWLTRWEQKLSTGKPIEFENPDAPTLKAWISTLSEAVASATRPVFIVAHGLGVLAVAHAAPKFTDGRVKGAFLVAPVLREAIDAQPEIDPAFARIPLDPLPFPSVLVASRNDPLAPFEESEDLSYAWGSAFVDAGEAGHLDAASEHGPWPEGLMRFAGFLSKL